MLSHGCALLLSGFVCGVFFADLKVPLPSWLGSQLLIRRCPICENKTSLVWADQVLDLSVTVVRQRWLLILTRLLSRFFYSAHTPLPFKRFSC